MSYQYTGMPIKVTPGAGTFKIEAYGARGGNAYNPNGGAAYVGGSGAEAVGTFQLTAGETLEIFVGGVGKTGTTAGAGYGGGGGGGTFVLAKPSGATSYTPLIIAGGGAGAGTDTGPGISAFPGLSKTGGGGGSSGLYYSGAGAGLKTSGANGTSSQSSNSTGGTSVSSATKPGTGGVYQPGGSFSSSGNAGGGGFGGGGAGDRGYGGGGGGYTGGNAGGGFSGVGGSGGTSFVAASATSASAAMASGENNEFSGNGEVVIMAVCYASGTLIRTTRGDVAVEALQVGDLAVTASGAHRPIRWLGHRDTDCARHPEPRKVWPVRVAAGALGAGLPSADLWLSPGHALCLDDVLYPVRALVYGDLIQQVEQDTVTYWHVELDSHDILIANGVQAESYLDTGNRSAFDNAAGVVDLHPDFDARSTDGFCRPYAESGPLLAAARFRLFGTGQTAAKPTVHLVADGLVLTPARCGNTLTFVVPERTLQLRLASPRRRANGADVRTLGVLIGSIVIETSAGRHDITLDDPRLFAGFHEVERTSAGSWRWTDGAGHFANDLWADADGAFVMRLTGMFDRAEDERSERIAA